MIKKLRIKFITVAMIAVFIVLGTVMSIINIHNYSDISERADRTLSVLADNGGKFPDDSNNTTNNKEFKPGDQTSDKDIADTTGKPDMKIQTPEQNHIPAYISPETPFETRFFIVSVSNENGDINYVNTDRIAAVDADSAAKYAKELYGKEKTKGYCDDYRYTAYESNDSTIYIFIDCGRELDTFREFMKTSILISLLSLIVVFILVVIFSGIVTKPVALTYKKQKQFITDANHELKTPLTVIDANCEVLELESGENEWTHSIKEQVKRLCDLTNKLIFLSRMDEENAKTSMTDFCISEIAHDSIKTFSPIAASHNKIIYERIDDGVTVFGDVSLIRQLFSILLDNAVKYTDDGGKITFELTKYAKSCRVCVSNTTNGVPAGELDILFERFYRLDSSRNSSTGGHGIGLSVAKAIVELHHGTISAHSDDGKTIVFSIIL